MALDITSREYGAVELESSFLVLGRDCGRTRRVLTLGFLIPSGDEKAQREDAARAPAIAAKHQETRFQLDRPILATRDVQRHVYSPRPLMVSPSTCERARPSTLLA